VYFLEDKTTEPINFQLSKHKSQRTSTTTKKPWCYLADWPPPAGGWPKPKPA
jgi:hypothetical protein